MASHRCKRCKVGRISDTRTDLVCYKCQRAALEASGEIRCVTDGCGGKRVGLCKFCGECAATMRNARGLVCEVPSCGRKQRAAGLCRTHYEQKLSGRECAPIRAKAPHGTGSINVHGYRSVWVDGEPIMQHRLVMAEAIGRPLRADEFVHHLNGDRADNRIENLELWSKSQPPGQRIADKLAWADELKALYEFDQHVADANAFADRLLAEVA